MKKIKIFAMMTCLVIAMAGLVGCGSQTSADETAGPAAVCYAIAPTANSQGLN